MSLPTALEDFGDWLALIAAIVAALGTVRVVGLWFAQTIGRPWRLARKIKDIGPGMRSEVFREALGPPDFGDEEHQTWVFPECLIYAIVRSGRVEAMAVTLRRPWFRVSVNGVRLGRQTFASAGGELDASATVSGVLGANRWGYSERWPSVSASNFQEFALALNDAGFVFSENDLDLVEAADRCEGERVVELRRSVKFNTVAVSAPGADLGDMEQGASFGPSVYTERLAPPARPRWLGLPVLRSTPLSRSFGNGR